MESPYDAVDDVVVVAVAVDVVVIVREAKSCWNIDQKNLSDQPTD